MPNISITNSAEFVKTQKTVEKAAEIKLKAAEISRALSDSYTDRGKLVKAQEISDCGTYLVFKEWRDPGQTATLHGANFCKDTLCPMCAWRRHLKYSAIISEVLRTNKQRYIYHIVLAIRNTPFVDKALLMHLKERGKSFIKQKLQLNDYISNLECVVSDTGYHPHLHIICTTNDYIGIDEYFIKILSLAWRRHFEKGGYIDNELADDKGYTIFIRGISRYKMSDEDLTSISLELSKYVVKVDGVRGDYSYIGVLSESLKGVRKISAGGLLAQGMRAAKKSLSKERYDKLISLQPYEWQYSIYNYINGIYEKKSN
jgi:plasmid rolling circle replication initiator protein Rep